jgi:hypothetical protein
MMGRRVTAVPQRSQNTSKRRKKIVKQMKVSPKRSGNTGKRQKVCTSKGKRTRKGSRRKLKVSGRRK